jgi:RNA exonuclease 1
MPEEGDYNNVSKKLNEIDFDEISDESRTEVLNRPKKLKRKYQVSPGFSVESTSITKKISISDLRDLVLWILAEHGPPSPNWILVRNKMAINHVVCLQVSGLKVEDFGLTSKTLLPQEIKALQCQSELSSFKHIFSHLFPTEAPGTQDRIYSAMTSFIEIPMTKAEKKERDKEAKLLQSSGASLTYNDLALNISQLRDYKFPLHPDTPEIRDDEKRPLEEGWADFVFLDIDRSPRLYAIDCEMCETQFGKELTRISVLDSLGSVLYDTLVKPHQPILNYLTRYSGITEEMLKDVTTRITDVQEHLTALISTSDFLVGHSLDSDMHALKMRHPRIIDTSVIFQHPKGARYRPSLKMITSKFLSREIQTGENGHDSKEDALACLDLLKLKIQNGPLFGLSSHPAINIAKKLALMDTPQTTAIIDYGVPHWHEEFARTVISCTDDDEIVENIIKQSKNHNFVWSRLRELEFLVKWSDASGTEGCCADDVLEEAYVRLNRRLQTLYSGLEENTALIVWTGTGDPREMFKLQLKKKQFQQEYNTKKWDELEVEWTSHDNSDLITATESARSGMSFIALREKEGRVEVNVDEEEGGPKKAKQMK